MTRRQYIPDEARYEVECDVLNCGRMAVAEANGSWFCEVHLFEVPANCETPGQLDLFGDES